MIRPGASRHREPVGRAVMCHSETLWIRKERGAPRGPSSETAGSNYEQVFLPAFVLQLFEQHWLLLVQVVPVAPQEPPPLGFRKAARLG